MSITLYNTHPSKIPAEIIALSNYTPDPELQCCKDRASEFTIISLVDMHFSFIITIVVKKGITEERLPQVIQDYIADKHGEPVRVYLYGCIGDAIMGRLNITSNRYFIHHGLWKTLFDDMYYDYFRCPPNNSILSKLGIYKILDGYARFVRGGYCYPEGEGGPAFMKYDEFTHLESDDEEKPEFIVIGKQILTKFHFNISPGMLDQPDPSMPQAPCHLGPELQSLVQPSPFVYRYERHENI